MTHLRLQLGNANVVSSVTWRMCYAVIRWDVHESFIPVDRQRRRDPAKNESTNNELN